MDLVGTYFEWLPNEILEIIGLGFCRDCKKCFQEWDLIWSVNYDLCFQCWYKFLKECERKRRLETL